jgi:hypothetical protein
LEELAVTQRESDGTDDVREILLNAIEVELAALKAAVGFWREWIEHSSKYIEITSKSLSAIRSAKDDPKRVLLEAVDASREAMRAMTDLPRKAAEDFLHELEALQTPKSASGSSTAKRRARVKP